MTAALTLARHSLRRARTLLVVLLGVLAGFEVLLVTGAAALQEAGTLSSFADMMPPFVRQLFGDSLIVFMSFSGIVCFGYFHPMIVAALVAFVIATATEPVGEIETRFVDIVMARPLGRASVMARSVLLVVLLPACVIGAMLLATLLAQHWLAPPEAAVPRSVLVALALNLWLLLQCVGGVALAVAASSRRRSSAAGLVGIAALALFFLDYLARIWKPAASVVWLSPFHYFDAMRMVLGQPLPGLHVVVLAATALVGTTLAFVVFTHRDL